MRRTLLTICLAMSTAAPTLASPNGTTLATEKTRAAEVFDKASRAYETQRWDTAADYYEEAYAIVPNPIAAEYAIRSHVKAKQWSRVANFALAVEADYAHEAELVKLCRATLGEASKFLHRLEYQCEAPCHVEVDGVRPPALGESSGVLFLSPGHHTLVAEFEQAKSKRSVEAVAGGDSSISFVAEREQPATLRVTSTHAADGPPNRGYSPVYFAVAAGLTALSTGITIWSGIDTLKHPGADRVRADCALSDTSCPTYRDGLAAQHRTNYLIATSAVLGLSTALIGVFLTDFGQSPKPTREARVSRRNFHPRVDASLGPNGQLGLELQGAF